ncbi:hypothetical protein CLU96_1914 [Chryseobacterium sp. 52]|uniref:hypothetical protein n=1 Tax=Chryseobacterium sp. 52 TaxID=2035213 RepID=UPI000C1A79A8|nr:hypothetical protein [Chryseobacterium sp. 52]PIF44916.1 hypothetical protein CLU96_1914 [Chryseobacterium sp. 52]
MPTNFPEIWLKRVIENVDRNVAATFLEGIPELDVTVVTINEGKLSEKNKMYVAATDFEVEVLINNNTYELDVQDYDDDTIEITLDKYQSLPTTVGDDDTTGASYSKIDTVTKAHTNGILAKKYRKAIHSIAPLEDTPTTPVIEATGGPDGLTDSTGRKRLVYEDLVNAKAKADAAGFGESLRRMVLCDNHWNDLLLDRKNFGNQLVDYAAGKPSPKIAGWELHWYSGNPTYGSDKKKKAFDAIAAAGDMSSSVFFSLDNIAKKTGDTKQYFSPSSTAPRTQVNELSYRHYYVVTPFQKKKIGAII